jgi:hypothetical protein
VGLYFVLPAKGKLGFDPQFSKIQYINALPGNNFLVQ